jgi:alpha-D-ribose 1-methylphosphonate 5-triphosphate synthase subunit PhnG
VIEPLLEAREARRRQARASAATTRVDFFTMVRGEE